MGYAGMEMAVDRAKERDEKRKQSKKEGFELVDERYKGKQRKKNGFW